MPFKTQSKPLASTEFHNLSNVWMICCPRQGLTLHWQDTALATTRHKQPSFITILLPNRTFHHNWAVKLGRWLKMLVIIHNVMGTGEVSLLPVWIEPLLESILVEWIASVMFIDYTLSIEGEVARAAQKNSQMPLCPSFWQGQIISQEFTFKLSKQNVRYSYNPQE